MNQAHWHLVLNHAPIFGALAGVLLLLAGLLGRRNLLVSAGLWAVVLAAAVGLPALLTGTEAAKVVGDMPQVSKELIKQHASAARLGYYVLVGAATLALLCWLMLRQQAARAVAMAWATLLLTAASFGLLARSANLGGHIQHAETREGFGTPDAL